MATVQPHSTEFGFAFVSENGKGRPSKATERRLIRSRCMRGKNRKIGVPRRVVHGRTHPFTGRHEDHSLGPGHGVTGVGVGGGGTSSSTSGAGAFGHRAVVLPSPFSSSSSSWASQSYSSRVYGGGAGRVIDLDADEDEDAVVDKLAALEEGVQLPSITARAAPSDIEAMQIASEASVEAKIRIFYFLRFFRHVIHPIELFFATVDITQQRAPTPATLYHMQRTIRLLNESLSSADRMLDVRDSTVTVVIILTIFSCMMGDGSGASATTFQFPGARGGYPYLTVRFRECCQQSMNEQWMWERWRKDVDQLDWKATRERLREIMWIDAMQDALGRDAFKQLNKYQMLVPV
ncbi:hypothetical protein BJX65DRAFT_311055 [Aspergillus insuetus]